MYTVCGIPYINNNISNCNINYDNNNNTILLWASSSFDDDDDDYGPGFGGGYCWLAGVTAASKTGVS